jgi:hypothetical protein
MQRGGRGLRVQRDVISNGGEKDGVEMGYGQVMNAEDKPVTLEKVEELYRFLQGDEIEGIHCKSMPRLSQRKAFSVIYFLQEHMNLVPDRFECCVRCGDLYDDHSEGHYDEKTGRHYCSSCL